MSNHYNWSVIPADNNDSDEAINWNELQPPDTVNNSARQMMARGAEWRLDMSDVRASAGATANRYEVTVQSTLSAYTNGMMFAFRAHQTNTGAAFLKINSLAEKPLRSISGADLGNNGIIAGQVILAFYNAASDEFLFPYANGVQQDGDARFNTLGIGQDDAVAGTVNIYGGNVAGQGGVLNIYNASGQDGAPNPDYYVIFANGADGDLEFWRSNGTGPAFAINANGVVEINGNVQPEDGQLNVGIDGTAGGHIVLEGAQAGQDVGSKIELRKSADNQGINGEKWIIEARLGNLNFRTGDPDEPKVGLGGDGLVFLTAYADGGMRILNGTILTDVESFPLGQNQSWEAIGHAGANVAQQNTFGRSIMISVNASPGQNQFTQVSADNANWITVGQFGSQGPVNSTFVVPAGHWWRYTGTTTNEIARLR